MFRNLLLSSKVWFSKKVNYLLRNMICFVENIILSKTVNYLLRKYDLFIWQYYFFERSSPGLRPNGVSGSLLDDPMVKGSYLQLFQGTPPAQKLHVSDGSEALCWPFGAPRPDFRSMFWSIGKLSQNHDFLESPQNIKNQSRSRPWRPMSPFWIQKHDI